MRSATPTTSNQSRRLNPSLSTLATTPARVRIGSELDPK
jgi:hypothetical protein